MLVNPQPPMAGHIFGLQLSNNSFAPNTTLDVSSGVAADSTNTYQVQLPSAFSKVLQTSGAWASGSGSDGLDTGLRTANTWYHVYLIRFDADGAGDILFSTSFSNPTLPSGYTSKRRLGSILTDASGNILPFTQTGDEFIWFNAAYDVQSITSLGTTSTLLTLSVPPDVKVEARIRAAFHNTLTALDNAQLALRSPDENPSQITRFVSGSGHNLWAQTQWPTNGDADVNELIIRTNTARQIAAICLLPTDNVVDIRTVGWFDQRGRLY